jgi:hypothetical protein
MSGLNVKRKGILSKMAGSGIGDIHKEKAIFAKKGCVLAIRGVRCHCEERSDEAISLLSFLYVIARSPPLADDEAIFHRLP